jgi:hypothetical protein
VWDPTTWLLSSDRPLAPDLGIDETNDWGVVGEKPDCDRERTLSRLKKVEIRLCHVTAREAAENSMENMTQVHHNETKMPQPAKLFDAGALIATTSEHRQLPLTSFTFHSNLIDLIGVRAKSGVFKFTIASKQVNCVVVELDPESFWNTCHALLRTRHTQKAKNNSVSDSTSTCKEILVNGNANRYISAHISGFVPEFIKTPT